VAASTGPVLIAGCLTAANELVFAPAAGTKTSFNWRLVPATAGLALALAGLEKIAPKFAVGLAWLTVATVTIVPLGGAPTPLQNALKVMGYAK
jgi:hypothetical protein